MLGCLTEKLIHPIKRNVGDFILSPFLLQHHATPLHLGACQCTDFVVCPEMGLPNHGVMIASRCFLKQCTNSHQKAMVIKQMPQAVHLHVHGRLVHIRTQHQKLICCHPEYVVLAKHALQYISGTDQCLFLLNGGQAMILIAPSEDLAIHKAKGFFRLKARECFLQSHPISRIGEMIKVSDALKTPQQMIAVDKRGQNIPHSRHDRGRIVHNRIPGVFKNEKADVLPMERKACRNHSIHFLRMQQVIHLRLILAHALQIPNGDEFLRHQIFHPVMKDGKRKALHEVLHMRLPRTTPFIGVVAGLIHIQFKDADSVAKQLLAHALKQISQCFF